ncbi:MAG: aminotransferase class IV, partial [Proteobacteria bacterium]
NCLSAGRARWTVYRDGGGLYFPESRNVNWFITASALENPLYSFVEKPYEIELFKDFYVAKQLLSSIKSTNRLLNVTAGIYATENGFDNCLLMNDAKNVVEAINGNIFMLTGNRLVTPPVSEGCLNGVMRRQIIAIASKMERREVVEDVISPFDLQKADEIFITNVISGILPVTKYRKKEFSTSLASELVIKLNAQLRLI